MSDQSIQAIYLHQKISDLKAMQECAIHALDNPLRADAGKQVLIQVVAKLSGLEEILEELARLEQAS